MHGLYQCWLFWLSGKDEEEIDQKIYGDTYALYVSVAIRQLVESVGLILKAWEPDELLFEPAQVNSDCLLPQKQELLKRKRFATQIISIFSKRGSS